MNTVDGIHHSGQKCWPFLLLTGLYPIEDCPQYGDGLLHCSLLLTSSRHAPPVLNVHGGKEVSELYGVLAPVVRDDHRRFGHDTKE